MNEVLITNHYKSMNLLTKSKPTNLWLTAKVLDVMKLTSVCLLALATHEASAATTENPSKKSEKNVTSKNYFQRTITGVVKNEQGEVLPGVNILAKGSKITAQTDFDGNFSIDVPDNVTTLVVSYIGLEEQEVLIGTAPLTIVLKEVGQQMNEVIVVGYGQQNRRTLSTSVSKLDK